MLRWGNRHLVSTLCHFLPHKPGVIAHAAELIIWMLIPINIVVKFLLSTNLYCYFFMQYYHAIRLLSNKLTLCLIHFFVEHAEQVHNFL